MPRLFPRELIEAIASGEPRALAVEAVARHIRRDLSNMCGTPDTHDVLSCRFCRLLAHLAVMGSVRPRLDRPAF
jgi:hypothetical protein